MAQLTVHSEYSWFFVITVQHVHAQSAEGYRINSNPLAGSWNPFKAAPLVAGIRGLRFPDGSKIGAPIP